MDVYSPQNKTNSKRDEIFAADRESPVTQGVWAGAKPVVHTDYGLGRIVSFGLASILTLSFSSCQSTSPLPGDPFASQPIASQSTPLPYIDHTKTESCSIVVSKTPPPGPKSIPTQVPVAAQAPATADPQPMIPQPTYKPVYEPLPGSASGTMPNPEKTRLVQNDPNRDMICQVVCLQENEETDRNATGSVSNIAPAKLNALTVEPALAEEGAKIVAQRNEGVQEFAGAWKPNTVAGYWPRSEYLADGGDRSGKIYVENDWTVRNMQAEDTVAHFDTVDGRTIVEPSNKVHLYAPRFASVRKVEGALNSGQIAALSGTQGQLALQVDERKEQLGRAEQDISTEYARTRDQLGGVAARKVSAGTETTQGLGGFGNFESVMSYTNRLTQRSIGSAELAYLAEGAVNARAWEGVEGVKVRINALAAASVSSEEGAESFFQIKEDESKTSKLRLIKVASKKSANPGEIVEFTLRFDNVGNQPIGNVTVIDHLTTRLEFLPGSAKSSLESGFVVEPNDSGSFTLRFEITAPLLPTEFGIVQFQCRVR